MSSSLAIIFTGYYGIAKEKKKIKINSFINF